MLLVSHLALYLAYGSAYWVLVMGQMILMSCLEIKKLRLRGVTGFTQNYSTNTRQPGWEAGGFNQQLPYLLGYCFPQRPFGTLLWKTAVSKPWAKDTVPSGPFPTAVVAPGSQENQYDTTLLAQLFLFNSTFASLYETCWPSASFFLCT